MVKIHVKLWRRHRQLWLAHLNRESMRQRIIRLLMLFVSLLVVHTLAMVVFESLSIREALWLTVISVTTIGYGDYSATTPMGQLATVVLICFFGIWLLAQLVGEWVDYRIQRRESMLKGEWNWKMFKQHLVIINTPNGDTTVYLERLTQQVRQTPTLSKIPIVLVSDAYSNGLPVRLNDLDIKYVQAKPEQRGVLTRANIGSASYVLIIAGDSQNPVSDSITFDILSRIKAEGAKGRIVAETVQDENKARFLSHGADAVMRPVRAYPELIVRSLAAPGTEQILENLFTFRGDSTYRYDIDLKAVSWKEIVLPILERDLGTPLGYMDKSGLVHTNPAGNTQIEGRAIFVLVRESAVPTLEQIRGCLA